jgi:putative two-component system response regulator
MHHRPTVLLVHDDLDARLRFGNWLSSGGYRCLTADDSASALRFAGRTLPDVAVIDIGRRNRDRLWLAGRLRERSTPIGVVLMSGTRSHDHLEAAARLGVAGLVVKPRGPEELLEAVERAASWRADEEARALDVRASVMQTVAARHASFKHLIRTERTADAALDAIGSTFQRGEPALLGHVRRVAAHALTLAKALHLSGDAAAQIRAAALLHDLGKLSLPEPVLLGDAPIGDSEMEALLDHHSRTLDLLAGHAVFTGAATLLESVFEWWDGRGYPAGSAGREIPFAARIIAAADVFDAARAGHSPHDGWAHRAAGRAALVRDAGARLDPDLVRVFLHLVDGPSCS